MHDRVHLPDSNKAERLATARLTDLSEKSGWTSQGRPIARLGASASTLPLTARADAAIFS